MAAPDVKVTAYAAASIDRACESASRSVDRDMHRGDDTRPAFGIWTGTMTFDYPNTQGANYGRLWLGAHSILTLTAAASGGLVIPVANVKLRPQYGPPYEYIELDRSTVSAFSMTAGTAQDAISLTGTWGYDQVEETCGTLAVDVSTTSTATVGVGAGAVGAEPFGIGDTLRIDSERMFVVGKMWGVSGQTATLASAANAQTIAVSSGAAFTVGEELLIESERVLVQDIAGNTLFVRRAWNGTALTQHSSASVYWPRDLVVQRGQLGTTAALHTNGATVWRKVVPGPIRQLALAYAMEDFIQPTTGYARTIRTPNGDRQASGRAMSDIRSRVADAYARRARTAAI